MAQLNLKQIADRLNAEFTQDTRKLVFWYDEKGEFADDINEIELANAKVPLKIPCINPATHRSAIAGIRLHVPAHNIF